MTGITFDSTLHKCCVNLPPKTREVYSIHERGDGGGEGREGDNKEHVTSCQLILQDLFDRII